ncbi:MAG: histidine ammonia-lyase [Salinivirgaceae bacterium]|jgi:histidine ammonia-lyase|nr:histidine ammonia-lyase [Bacteroidales bacterium]
MDNTHFISPENLGFHLIEEIIENEMQLTLSDEAIKRITRCREYLDKKVESHPHPIYGVNTGFGSLCNVSVSKEDLSTLQKNLVMSHACGTGNIVNPEIVQLMLLLKIHALSLGHSGVQVKTVQRLIDMYNNKIYPVVYEQGSLGASGDLAPLAHMCLPLLGLGEVVYNDEIHDFADLMGKFNWEPIELQSKEGLALLNGTQFMSAHAVHSLLRCFRLINYADIIGALSLDGFDGRIEPFFEHLHTIRPHKGQLETAENIRAILEGSEIIAQPKKHVQDPYSFRCMPQVHGATKDTLKYVASVVLTEINSVTDNPTVFPDEDQVLSGGNFHGQPLALVLDFLAIAMSELANISERRTAQLILGLRGLPEFLVANPGLNSGFMIPQYTAAAIVSQNKGLCMPASVDSIVSSNGQEDHVSMGANAATKLVRVIDNVETVLAIELFNAAQAVEFREPLKTSPYLRRFLTQYRSFVESVQNDKVMFTEIEKSVQFLSSGRFSYLE